MHLERNRRRVIRQHHNQANLTDYIILIYNLLLIAVGIAAMFMIVVGGFRYLTAAGNAAALSEAKDIIYSALYGLLLAISAWVIVSTINPDLVYLKKPGTTVSHSDYSCAPAGTACNTCAGGDGCKPGCVPADPDCPGFPGATVAGGDGCSAPPDPNCNYSINCCYESCGHILPEECPTWTGCTDPTITTADIDGNCTCLDGEKVSIIGTDCNETCRTTEHCGWNFLVVRANIDDRTEVEIEEGTSFVLGDPRTWDLSKVVETFYELDLGKAQLWDFFLTNNGDWGAFKVTSSSYDENDDGVPDYECAILVTARRTTLGGITGDYRNIFWVLPGTVLSKDSLYLEKGLCKKFAQCCHRNGAATAKNACRIAGSAIPGCDWKYYDPNECAISKSTKGTNAPPNCEEAGKLFKTKYSDGIENENIRCSDENPGADDERSCSMAESETAYHPVRDLICDPSTGMWR